jgi:hypothetical protein
MIPRWLKAKTPQVAGREFEKKLAKKIGGRVQPGSGAFPGMREDITTLDYLVQAKFTTAKSFKLNFKDLETLRKNAALIGKVPLFVLEMGGRRYNIREGIL